jgi:hypothetical protein
VEGSELLLRTAAAIGPRISHCTYIESYVSTGRPEWFRELLMVKEKGILRGEYELLRIDWGKEDDQVVDELLVGGQVAEAQQYFEQKKAMSVPIYRQTLRYHWTQSGENACLHMCH